MTNLDYIHAALSSLYPGISPLDYVWQSTEGGAPEMVSWPEGRYGPLDWPMVLAECERQERKALIAGIKAEAGRRITEVFPIWKQNNMLMRALSLSQKGADSWTPEEADEAASLQYAQEWIMSVRVASDALEATDPLPEDFRSDAHWPDSPEEE
ncbi:hypothetical protein [Pyruvatibacter mobilis]|uniref:hypothetical protein n=1 Tax=Pyruvatibacter mobilis TaxID=1712261 RepID=UPI003BAB9818